MIRHLEAAHLPSEVYVTCGERECWRQLGREELRGESVELTTLERLADDYLFLVKEKLRGAALRAADHGEQPVHLFAGDQA